MFTINMSGIEQLASTKRQQLREAAEATINASSQVWAHICKTVTLRLSMEGVDAALPDAGEPVPATLLAAWRRMERAAAPLVDQHLLEDLGGMFPIRVPEDGAPACGDLAIWIQNATARLRAQEKCPAEWWKEELERWTARQEEVESGLRQLQNRLTVLNKTMYDFLEALCREKAFDPDHLQTTSNIAKVVAGEFVNAEQFKAVVSKLKQLGLADTREGRGGGCWITKQGEDLIRSVRKL
jgi:hypothetical protein